MSIFKNVFKPSSGSKANKTIPWIPLEDIQQIDNILSASETRTQLIFKHSTHCGISKMVKNRFTDTYNYNSETVDLYYLDLLKYREISNTIAETLEVQHQSPQLLVVRNREVVSHASHNLINNMNLDDFV